MSDEEAPKRVSLDPDLLKLYELALQEYRFQVLLNWDRAKHAFIVNGALLAAAATALRYGDEIPKGLTIGLMCLVVAGSILGVLTIRRQHDYYRATTRHKANLEQALGLTQLGYAMNTTAGMRDAAVPEEEPLRVWVRAIRSAGKITTMLQAMLIAFAAGSALAIYWIATR